MYDSGRADERALAKTISNCDHNALTEPYATPRMALEPAISSHLAYFGTHGMPPTCFSSESRTKRAARIAS